jgi:predicted nuclease of predicted toxin-antitoxin system
VLVIDECLSTRLATELNSRGRPATSIAALGLRGLADPAVFEALGSLAQPYVIVTADGEMPSTG